MGGSIGPAMNTRTIRLFVSSTFSDMRAERDILQAKVYPRFHQLCAGLGFRFQAIDLRWGVSEEAGNHNRTMRVCQRELRRCRAGSSKPNFLILLGDRYGWRPLPEILSAEVFEILRALIPAEFGPLLGPDGGWYRFDDNAVPPVYELRPRGSFPNWTETVERPLLAAMNEALLRAGRSAEANGLGIGTSATEQEIQEGALSVEDAHDHVHALFRMMDYPEGADAAGDFSDLKPDGTPDPAAQQRLGDLKARIAAHLGESNVHQYRVNWREGGPSRENLAEFAEQAYAVLESVVLKQAMAMSATPAASYEESEHLKFSREHGSALPTRTDALDRILDHLGSREPGFLAVLGSAGCGKSALLAEAVRRARQAYGEATVAARFVGVTPASSNLAGMLLDLVCGVRRLYPSSDTDDSRIPSDLPELIAAFHEALGRPSGGRPMYLFLDALNGLSGGGSQSLHWLPLSLNPNVRLVVSASEPEEGWERLRGPAAAETLERRAGVGILRLPPLSRETGQALMHLWLKRAGRRLEEAQERAILDAFEREGNPLWLSIAVRESLSLATGDPPPRLETSLPRLVGQILVRLSAESRHGRVLLENVLRFLACAREGLAEDELIELLSAETAVMRDFRRRFPKSPPVNLLPVTIWVALFGDLESYLAERDVNGVSLLRFHRQPFLDALDDFAPGPPTPWRRAMAVYFGKQFDRDGARAARALRELPVHQARAGLWSEAFATMTSPVFLEGRLPADASQAAEARGSLLLSLAEDYELVAEEMS